MNIFTFVRRSQISATDTASFISTKSNHFQQRSASCQVKTELQEWRASPSQKPLHSAVDLGTVKHEVNHEIDVWADASSYGMGILIDDHFLAWKYCLEWKGWRKDGYDIDWAETIGLELAIRCLVASNLSGANFLVHNDNAGAIEAVKKGHSRNLRSNESIARMNPFLSSNPHIKFEHVKSETNKADPISRGNFMGYKSSPLAIELPESLSGIITRVDSQNPV